MWTLSKPPGTVKDQGGELRSRRVHSGVEEADRSSALTAGVAVVVDSITSVGLAGESQLVTGIRRSTVVASVTDPISKSYQDKRHAQKTMVKQSY